MCSKTAVNFHRLALLVQVSCYRCPYHSGISRRHSGVVEIIALHWTQIFWHRQTGACPIHKLSSLTREEITSMVYVLLYLYIYIYIESMISIQNCSRCSKI